MEESTALPQENKRPSFLSTLCILTFIGAGLMLLMTLIGTPNAFKSADEMATEMMDNMSKYAETNPAVADMMSTQVDSMMEMQKYALPNWILGLLGNILTLVGAIWMWNLKKTGFYLYCAVELIPSMISMFFLGGTKMMTASFAMMGMESLGSIIVGLMIGLDLLFIGLYAMNLKHMK